MIDRFLDKVMADPNSGCWLWTAGLNTSGYGQASNGSKPVKAHRLSYSLFKGEIPVGKHVLHKCDIRSCVNPDHLFLGDNAINVADKMAKGRGAKHEGHGRSKLTESQVSEIRKMASSPREIAAAFGVSSRTIYDIKQEKTWKFAA